TDIEYYISHKKNPAATDWKPILPVGKTYVQGELLSGDLYPGDYPEVKEQESKGNPLIVYSLRFPAVSSQTLTIRRNGIAMHPSTYVLSDDGRKVGIMSKFYTA